VWGSLMSLESRELQQSECDCCGQQNFNSAMTYVEMYHVCQYPCARTVRDYFAATLDSGRSPRAASPAPPIGS
jgi:hypothetical protein